MRYLFFSDVHGDASKLARLPVDSVDKVFFLGDAVGDFTSPNECIDFLRANNVICVMGNHDAFTVGRLCLNDFTSNVKTQAKIDGWIKSNLSVLTPENLVWLKSLPFKYEDNLVTVVHANPLNFTEFLENGEVAGKHFDNFSTPFLFHGHMHVPQVFDGFSFRFIECKEYLTPKSIVGVPSTSRSWDGSKTGYLIFDTDTKEVEFFEL
ncbi:MAG TPA: metallophosphoesterase family protein [Candidatus Nanoarchaeia archaeon]|nr:metallophosphoesterase family protein [Candidatus Nanoarchaeia archaeon]